MGLHIPSILNLEILNSKKKVKRLKIIKIIIKNLIFIDKMSKYSVT